jgi:hypothetical protein
MVFELAVAPLGRACRQTSDAILYLPGAEKQIAATAMLHTLNCVSPLQPGP